MLLSKLREAAICFKAGRVTLGYPFTPHDPPPGFRGKIVVDPDRCFGCGGCAHVCPAGVITVRDADPSTRELDIRRSGRPYCGRCAEICPEGAITMSRQFETATNRREDMEIHLRVFMGPCQRCGRCFAPPPPLEGKVTPGFRQGTGARA